MNKAVPRMTTEWHYTVEDDFGILSVVGHLGPEAVTWPPFPPTARPPDPRIRSLKRKTPVP